MRTLKDINFEGQRAIVRVDFNVPLDKDLQITDITRIKAAKPTIDYILSKGGSCVLLSHLGRPNGFEQSLSFQNIIDKVSEILETKVQFCKTSICPIAQSKADSLMPGEVLLMENLRFNAEETEGDVVFLKDYPNLGQSLSTMLLEQHTDPMHLPQLLLIFSKIISVLVAFWKKRFWL